MEQKTENTIMDNTETRETNILESKEKFEAFENSFKEKLVERLLNTPLQNFSFDAYSVCFTVILPKNDEFPYAVKLHMDHQEARTGLDIDWTKVDSGESPEVYEVRPAAIYVYTNIYKPDMADDENVVHLHRYARALQCAEYKAPFEFCYSYNSEKDPEIYEKLHKLYLDVRDNYKARCKTLCKAYTEECWRLFDMINDY